MNKPELSIILTLFNRANEIEDTVLNLQTILIKHKIIYEIILCDDGSLDNTLSVCNKISDKNNNIKVTGYNNNKGRGYAVRHAASFCEGNKIFYLDSDIHKTTPLSFLIDGINKLNNYNIVIGNRFDSKINNKRIWYRFLVGKAFIIISRIFFPEIKNISDTESGFKGFQKLYFFELISNCSENKWGLDLQIILIAIYNKMKIYELPIIWNEKHENYTSSVKIIKDCILQFFTIIRLRLKYYKNI